MEESQLTESNCLFMRKKLESAPAETEMVLSFFHAAVM